MYQQEELTVYPYFQQVLQDNPLSSVLDSLTGVVSRGFILGFLRDLIRRGVEFTVGMIDLDNFKAYNDNYGHAVGDRVLSAIGRDLRLFVASSGLVGRFGGDEFLIVAFIGNDYQHVHNFFEGMFNQSSVFAQDCVFRRFVYIDQRKLFVSATAGSACFPKDAQDFDGLFSLVDKTLYRGKSKGRNCYIIYVPEKHDHLEIPRLARKSLYHTLAEMAAGFDREGDLRQKMQGAFVPMRRNMRFHYLFHVDQDHRVVDVESGQSAGQCEDLSGIMSDGFFACSQREELMSFCPRLSDVLDGYGLYSALIMPVSRSRGQKEYILLCPEPLTLHIWQDEEYAAGYFLTRLISTGCCGRGPASAAEKGPFD